MKRMTGQSDIDELTLIAYLDGELDPARAREVAAWLDQHPQERARLESWRANDDALRAALAPVAQEAVPGRLTGLAKAPLQRTQPSPQWRALAASVVLVFGLAGGWIARGQFAGVTGTEPAPGNPAALASRALDAHIVYAADLRHPVEVRASEHEHLNTWLSRRLQTRISAPDLTSAGYTLIGGRLLSNAGRPAALFMYEDASGKRLSVVATAALNRTERPVRTHVLRDDIRAMGWSEGALNLAVAAPLDGDRLRGIQELIRSSVKSNG